MSEIDWSKAPEGATHYDKWLGSPFLRMIGFDSWEFWSENNECWLSFRNYTPGEGVTKRIEESWAGEGLPPVGTVCEVQHESLGWTRCEIVAHKVMDSTGVTMAIAWIDANTLDQSQGIRFRPIRTQAQIEAEERKRALQEIEELITGYSYGRCAENLYQAGYRKQGEAK